MRVCSPLVTKTVSGPHYLQILWLSTQGLVRSVPAYFLSHLSLNFLSGAFCSNHPGLLTTSWWFRMLSATMIRNPNWHLEERNVFCHLTGILETGWARGMMDLAAQWCHQGTHLSALPWSVLDSTSNQKQLAAAVPSIMSRHGGILKRKGHCLSCGFLLE